MSSNILRDSVIIGAIAVATALAAANREEIYDYFGLMPVEDASTSQQSEAGPQGAMAEPALDVTVLSGTAVSIPKSKSDGQFWAEARVNSGMVKFLVDTGASTVALTPEDARRAGIRLETLEYNVPISTAGGQNVGAYVELKSVSVGAVTIRNVKALVVPEGLHVSLLGMTYLGQLQKVEATPNALILRL